MEEEDEEEEEDDEKRRKTSLNSDMASITIIIASQRFCFESFCCYVVIFQAAEIFMLVHLQGSLSK